LKLQTVMIAVMTLKLSDVSSRDVIYHSGFLNNLFLYGTTAPCGTGSPHYRGFTITCCLTDHIR